jgi:DNA adenine methylase
MKPLTAFGYFGSKAKLADFIGDILNTANAATYIEPFGGSGAVLLNKGEHAQEVYGDVSLALCCFWKAMSNPTSATTLIEHLYDTNHDPVLFETCLRKINAAESGKLQIAAMSSADLVSLGAACYVLYTQSRNNLGDKWGGDTRFRDDEGYLSTIDRLYDVADRVRGIEVVHADVMSLLRGKYNHADVVAYLDPPYLRESGSECRGKNPGEFYRYCLNYEQHVELLKRIRRLRCKVLISNYDDSTHLYARYLEQGEEFTGKFKAWERIECDTVSVAAQGEARTECFWKNF